MKIRPSRPEDAAALAGIYGHHVLHGTGTFEEAPPSAGEMAQRREAVIAQGLPHLVAEEDGAVVGFAYASPFRSRAAYRYLIEDSVYIHPDWMGRGVGKALLAPVISACEAMGFRQMVAVIGDSQNAGSINLHRSLGFEDAGVGKSFGYKAGRWVDVVFMQRALGKGDGDLPE